MSTFTLLVLLVVGVWAVAAALVYAANTLTGAVVRATQVALGPQDEPLVLTPEALDKEYRKQFGEPEDDGQMTLGKELDGQTPEVELPPLAGPAY